jgi:hypothetical protein
MVIDSDSEAESESDEEDDEELLVTTRIARGKENRRPGIESEQESDGDEDLKMKIINRSFPLFPPRAREAITDADQSLN